MKGAVQGKNIDVPMYDDKGLVGAMVNRFETVIPIPH